MLRLPRPQRIFVVCLVIAVLALLTFFHPQALESQECSPPDYCEPPPDNPSGDNSGGWSGYSDGRLSPDMAEYYTIYCKNDFIEVWGGVPSPQLMNAIPMVDVIALGDIGSFDAGNGLTVSRTGDTILVSGSNGNGAGPGSKAFSLNDCIATNGGAPELPSQPLVQRAIAPTDTPDPFEQGKGDVNFCLSGAASIADFIDCLKFFAPDDPSNNYVYFISWVIGTLCAGGMTPFALVASVPAISMWRRRRRK